ncbi:MAG: glycosyltransferase family 4 protein [Pseudomonadota bacterium]
MKRAAFAIPGDINTVTGGYIYERRLLEGLRAQGREVEHVQLGATFPAPSPCVMAHAVGTLGALSPDRVLILDGLVFGAIDTSGLAKVPCPIVAMLHHPLALETGLSAADAAWLFKTERDNLTLAAHVLVTSPYTADLYTREFDVDPSRITVALPGTDPQARSRAPSDPPLILSVGLQHPRKGHDVLLRALAQMTDHPWEAVIVGSAHNPDHAAMLADMVDALGLGDRVRLAGRISSEALDELYGRAAVFALATRFEGYGMVFDEALTWGMPIVTCETGAVPQTVPADAGRLVPPDDPGAFAAALRSVVSDGALRGRMGAAAAQAGRRLPTWDDTARIAGTVLDAL